MIFDAIIEFFLFLPKMIVGSLPRISIGFPDNLIGNIINFFEMLGFFLPLGTFVSILAINLALYTMRISFALVKKVIGR